MDATIVQQQGEVSRKDALATDIDSRREDVSASLRASHHSLSAALADAEAVALHMMQLQEVTAALSKARTEDEVAETVLRMGLAVVAGVGGVLARVDGKCFQRIAAVGFPPELQARVLAMAPGDECPLARVAKWPATWSGPKEEPSFFRSVPAS